MIEFDEALELAKARGRYPNIPYRLYAKFNGMHMFCHGDPENWVTVNENNGNLGELQRMSEIARILLFGEKEDPDYLERLEEAIDNVVYLPSD